MVIGKKATKIARKVFTDFEEVKVSFLQRLKDEVETNHIPLGLLLN